MSLFWEIKRCHILLSWENSYDEPRQCIKQTHQFADKGLCCQSYSLSNSHVRMWELDYKEGWVLKNWCFWTVVLEKILEIPLGSKESKPVDCKGDQPWVFIGKTDAKAETPILWPPDEKSWLIGNDPEAGQDWRWEEKGETENEMVGWHHRLNAHEFEQALGDSEGQGSLVFSAWCGGLACCSPWGHRESDMTERLNGSSPCLGQWCVSALHSVA